MSEVHPSPASTFPVTLEPDPLGGVVRDEVGLALSGGGFKATLFHLGGLIRLNELGALPRIHRISSVSGGSITAAWLGLQWTRLEFDDHGRATNFDPVIRAPLERFCSTARIDVSACLKGLLNPFSSVGAELEKAYARALFGETTLQDLPEPGPGVPAFVLNATNLQLNSLWRFSRARAADARIGEIPNPAIPLARVVAASSGFPPVLSPIVFEFAEGEVRPYPNADRAGGMFLRRAVLADGGLYDNLGLETLWKRCRTVLVSNAGNPFPETEAPGAGWPGQLRRVISILHRQGENHRMRWLVSMAEMGHRTVAAWTLRGGPGLYGDHGLTLDTAERQRVGETEVRLRPPPADQYRLLIRHGYSMADASVRRFWLRDAPSATAWPRDLHG